VRGKDGDFLAKGRRVAGFPNAEEEAVALTSVVPLLLDGSGSEESSIGRGRTVEVDGLLITGQNPASSELVVRKLLKLFAF